jgi:hypothetical protein
MNTKRNALVSGILLLLLVTSACGGAAATQAPAATEAPAELRLQPGPMFRL